MEALTKVGNKVCTRTNMRADRFHKYMKFNSNSTKFNFFILFRVNTSTCYSLYLLCILPKTTILTTKPTIEQQNPMNQQLLFSLFYICLAQELNAPKQKKLKTITKILKEKHTSFPSHQSCEINEDILKVSLALLQQVPILDESMFY